MEGHDLAKESVRQANYRMRHAGDFGNDDDLDKMVADRDSFNTPIS